MALVETPRLLVDPEWEERTLGPFVDRARILLERQRRTGRPALDLRPVLRRAYDRVPFYQALFRQAALGRRDLEDPRAIDAIPVTRRSDLSSGITPFLAHPTPRMALDRGWLGRTSGSTGRPIPYLRDPRTHAWFWAFLDHALRYVDRPVPRSGRRAGVVLLDAIGHMPEYEAFLPLFHRTRFAKVSVAAKDDLIAARLSALAPQVITGDPDSLACLARIELPRRARPSLVLSSAFALPDAVRRGVEAATGAAVLEYYGTQETSVIALSCRAGNGFHAVSGACHFAALPTAGGAHEIVVTPLHNPSFVLIRYAPGDLVMVDAPVSRGDDRCACGLRGPRITRLLGRTHVQFRAVGGASFAPGRLTPLLSRLPVAEHRLVQHAVDRYELRYLAERALPRTMVDSLETRLQELSGADAKLMLRRAHGPLHASGEKPIPFEVCP